MVVVGFEGGEGYEFLQERVESWDVGGDDYKVVFGVCLFVGGQ